MSAERRIIPLGEEPPPVDLPEVLPRYNGQRAAKAAGAPRRSARNQGGRVRRRFGLLHAFIDQALPDLCRSDLVAWLLLYRHAMPDGTATASVADLARRANCRERAMRYALKRLREAGLVERIKRGTLAGGPSVWRLRWPGRGGS